MKKKYLIGSVAVVVLSLCSYELGRHQTVSSKENNRVAYVNGKSKANKGKQAENLSPDEVSAKEGINAEQIVVKITDQGYVTSHGDHYHYYNGKVPYDAIISEELIMRDPNYTLQQSDIINEVKDGYIIKVNGKYYLYLKDPNHTSNVRTKEEIARQRAEYSGKGHKGAKGGAVTTAVKEARAQGRYTTDDGYVFNPTDVIEDTGDGFIVPHGNHFHYIPKKDLSPSELAAAQSYWDNKHKSGGTTSTPSPSPTPSRPSNGGTTLPSIHYQPSTPGTQTHQGNNYHAQPSQPSHQNTPSAHQEIINLLKQLYLMPLNQRHVESDGLIFDPAQITKKSSSGVAVPHGNHYHFIYYSQMSPLEEKISRMIVPGTDYSEAKKLAGQSNQQTNPSKPNQDTGKDQTQPNKPNDGKQTEPSKEPEKPKEEPSETEVTDEQIQTFINKAESLMSKVTNASQKANFEEQLAGIKSGFTLGTEEKATVLQKVKDLLSEIVKAVDPETQAGLTKKNAEIVAAFKKVLTPIRQTLESKGDKAQLATVEDLMQQAANPNVDKLALLDKVLKLSSEVQHPERAGKANSQIAYTADEVALAKAAGRYATSDGYIFDPHDLTEDQGDGYTAPHMNHSHYIPKSDLSKSERQAAEAYMKNKKPQKSEDNQTNPNKETALSIYNRVTPAKKVPVEAMPYNTAYVVDMKNGQLIIPHHDHYHNISLSWFDQGLYKAPDGYSMEDFLATVKYYVTHPGDRPHSDNGFGNSSQHGKKNQSDNGKNYAPNEEPKENEGKSANKESDAQKEKSEETEEQPTVDPEEAAEEARAKSYGLSVQEFKKKLIKIAFKYNVSLENLSYQPANKTVSFTDASGTTKVVNILTAEVVS
ncbi:pneumococcal-type histidine triad protein [Streptococcus constellatus subsp. viborgensis]|uniref:pneumococcal-type histidine triad protein n=1 Tax=Streptococcus constellatus TaxID=76860 RepID=UPI0018E1245D|nr:pneumococcal-type histidine triad protein [Streptococcus constellatus]QQC23519.1 pneumococcal-type histidine triad protein [Streptococcus constellatus]